MLKYLNNYSLFFIFIIAQHVTASKAPENVLEVVLTPGRHSSHSHHAIRITHTNTITNFTRSWGRLSVMSILKAFYLQFTER